MQIENISVGGTGKFRTMKMDPARPDHAGQVTAIHTSVRGAWVEFTTADGSTFKTRAGLVSSFKAAK